MITRTFYKNGTGSVLITPVDKDSLPFTIDFTIDKITSRKMEPNFGGLSAEDVTILKDVLVSFGQDASQTTKTVDALSKYRATLTKTDTAKKIITISYTLKSCTGSCETKSERVAYE